MTLQNKLIPSLLLLFSLNFCLGQEYKPHPLLSPMWQAEGEFLSPTQVSDTTLRNGFRGGSLRMRIPLYRGKDWLKVGGGKPYIAVLAQGGASARATNVSYIDPDRVLTTANLGITALMAKGVSSLRNLYMLQAGATLPTESFWFRPDYIRYHGALIWRHLYHNNKFWHTIGVIYSPISGRDLFLPVIGGGMKIGNEDYLQATLPFNIAYTHRFSPKFSLTTKLNMNGSYYYLKTDAVHDKEPVIYRQRYAKLSLMGRYYTDRHVVVTPEVGFAGKSHLEINGKEDTQAPAFYCRLTFQIRFGKRPAASPILNFDPGDSGFDPSYLVE